MLSIYMVAFVCNHLWEGMNANNQFDAPWGRLLRLMTSFCLVICLGIACIGIVSIPADHPLARLSMIVIPLLLLLGGACFMVRGYTLEDGRLIIHRLGWSSHVDLASLASAVHDPTAMAGSIRIAGNG